MKFAPVLASVLGVLVIAAASLMDNGLWCYRCAGEAMDECWAGTCLSAIYENHVDVEHHEPDVSFAGGD